MPENPQRKGLLIIGAGVAGMEAALEAAGAGFKVSLLEEARRLQVPQGLFAHSLPSRVPPVEAARRQIYRISRDPRIDVLTRGELVRLDGEFPDFHATIKTRPAAVAQSPVALAVNGRLHEALDILSAQNPLVGRSRPRPPAQDNAIVPAAPPDPSMPRTAPDGALGAPAPAGRKVIDVAAVILAAGDRPYDALRAGEYGYGRWKNVLTHLDFERRFSTAGAAPFTRPSDGKIPQRIAFIQCVGSRSTRANANPWCSSICCLAAIRETTLVKETYPGTEITIFAPDIMAHSRGLQEIADAAERLSGVRFIHTLPAFLKEIRSTGDLLVKYVTREGKTIEENFDLAILSVGFEPAPHAARTAGVLGITLNQFGFPDTAANSPVETSRRGVFVAGSASEPKGVGQSVTEAQAAVARAAEIVHLATRDASPDGGHPGASVGKPRVIVLGGGAAGMTAALSLSHRAVATLVVEKEDTLGGNLRNLRALAPGKDPTGRLRKLILDIEADSAIEVFTGSMLSSLGGRAGAFEAGIETPSGTREVRCGAVIVATGAAEYRGNEYLYGKDRRVVTQSEFERELAGGHFDGHDAVVMVQCVGSRNAAHPWCSRVCCGQAVRNALAAKHLLPQMPVYILHRDIRTFGFRDAIYREAREAGVHFIRFADDGAPAVDTRDEALLVEVFDIDLGEKVSIDAGRVVLSVGIVPRQGAGALAELLGVPLAGDGFFCPTDIKVKPVDFEREGVYLCGLAAGPAFYREVVAQALAAAGRAAVFVLSGG